MVKRRIVATVPEILQYLDEAIREKGTSRSSVEDAHGLSPGLISRWMKGTNMPTIDRLMELLNAMDIEVTLKCCTECPKFWPKSDVFDSELLEQKLKERLKYQLEGDIAKLLKEVLFSKEVTLGDKKKIYKCLGYLIAVEEMKEM